MNCVNELPNIEALCSMMVDDRITWTPTSRGSSGRGVRRSYDVVGNAMRSYTLLVDGQRVRGNHPTVELAQRYAEQLDRIDG